MAKLTSNGYKIVDGVLKNNINVRNEHLLRNNGKYNMYEPEFINAIGESVNINTRELTELTDGKSLYEYTSDKNTQLGEKIQNTYFNNNLKKDLYSILNPTPAELLKWKGKYEDYIKYVSDVYGKEYTIIRLIDGLFADLDLNCAMNLTKVGVVKDINVPKALAGVNTTNINNYSGTDTPLGRLTNQIYAQKLYQASIFNSSRGTKYITPSLVSFYGNNLQNLSRLSDILVPDKTGKVLIDNENEFKFLGSDSDEKTNGQFNFIPEKIRNGINPYIEIIDNIPTNKIFDGIGMTTSKVYAKKLKDSPPKDYFIYKDFEGATSGDTEWELFHLSGGTKTLGIPGENNLLAKTQKLFTEKKIKTMIGRYYLDDKDYKSTVIDTAIDDNGYRSHGRNLLQKKYEEKLPSGDTNPYCRTWTWKTQYKKVSHQIRPFSNDSTIKKLKSLKDYHGRSGGSEYLSNNTVLNLVNGRVNVAPSEKDKIDIKKCMFSIENLAWKDVLKPGSNLSKEQTGPNGGRIMWFPPYGLDFNESVKSDWDSNAFIGRGEKVYTYKDTTRSANLSFILLIDHPAMVSSFSADNSVSDADILRFFAGCDVPNAKLPERKQNEANSANNDIKWDDNDGNYIEFSVYFPNNYSGNGKPITKPNWEKLVKNHGNSYGCSDEENWYKYIIKGRNAINFGGGNGYEINDSGITQDEIANETIIACTTTERWKECTGKETNNKFYYRVDFDLKQNGIGGNGQYLDNYKDIRSYKLNSEVQTTSNNVFSFKDAYDCFVNDTVNGIHNALTGNTITKIECVGVATIQDKKNTSTLAERRAYTLGCTVLKWLNRKFNDGVKNVNWKDKKNFDIKVEDGGENQQTINDRVSKSNRRAAIRIYYNKSTSENVSNSKSGQTTAQTAQSGNSNGSGSGATINNSSVVTGSIATNNVATRYEGEAQYFEKLKANDPIIWKRIKEKIKYFDPAYHSISPEGFNARLTFLQQCTRQGHTISATENDGSAMTAGNLAFGRMPVCVLRLGDFIHTKIIIRSLSINYSVSNGMQWDMNEEGAGVQPMMAKITIAFDIIGGQSLEAPINRLQNAVSFNYYANAGVYDDRADKAHLNNSKLVYDSLFNVNNKK